MTNGQAGIYLAGPMTGLSWEKTLAWREHVEVELGRDWKILSPARPQQDQDRTKVLKLQTQENNELNLWDTATGVVASDTFLIDQSDWVLANFLGAEKISVGTVWELGYAYHARKKIIVLMSKEDIHNHPFTRRGVDMFTDDIEQVIEFFKRIKP